MEDRKGREREKSTLELELDLVEDEVWFLDLIYSFTIVFSQFKKSRVSSHKSSKQLVGPIQAAGY